MDMGNEKKKYVCIYMLKGMLRTSIAGDTLREVYDLLEMKEVVSGPADGLTVRKYSIRSTETPQRRPDALQYISSMRTMIQKLRTNSTMNISSAEMVFYN